MTEAGTISISLKSIYLSNIPYFTKSSIDENQKNNNNYLSLLKWMYPDIQGTTALEHNGISRETCENTIDTFSSNAGNSNKNRIQLLARKYIYEKLSPEDEARLEIEKQRVKQLIPLVTKEDYKVIGDLLDDLNKFKKQHKRIRKSLGIK